jgi:hypothetical protein
MRHQAFKWGIAALLFGAVLVVFIEPALAAKFENPLGSVKTPNDIIERVAMFMVGLVGVLALLSLVWGGVLYVISFGNDEYIKQAKKIIFWAIVGLSVVILAYVILATAAGFLGITTTTI